MRTLLVFILLFSLTSHSWSQDRLTGEIFTTRSEVLAQNGMAATSQPLATQVALDILKKGGSAMDAAIAANAVLGLVEPASCGIGGDIFAIVWSNKEKKLYGFNGSGRSPKSLNIDYFIDKQMKLLKGTDRGKNKLRELFLEPRIEQKGRFTVTVYEF